MQHQLQPKTSLRLIRETTTAPLPPGVSNTASTTNKHAVHKNGWFLTATRTLQRAKGRGVLLVHTGMSHTSLRLPAVLLPLKLYVHSPTPPPAYYYFAVIPFASAPAICPREGPVFPLPSTSEEVSTESLRQNRFAVLWEYTTMQCHAITLDTKAIVRTVVGPI